MGLSIVRRVNQLEVEKHRKTYELAFPADLDEERVVAWLRAVSGTMRTRTGLFGGTPTICLELLATNEGFRHYVKIPWQLSDFIVSQLRAQVPGIRVTPVDWPPIRSWTKAIELGLTNTQRSLRIFNAADMSATLLSSVQALQPKESVLLQWVVSPARPQHAPEHRKARTVHLNAATVFKGLEASKDEVNDRRSKLDEPNVVGVMRVAVVAASPERSDHLIYRVNAALRSARSAAVAFKKRLVFKETLSANLDHGRSPGRLPSLLNVRELAALIAWPIGNPNVPGLPPVMARHLGTPDNVPKEGRVLGRSNMPGSERTVAVDYVSALKHTHISGPTGTGKSVLMANLMKQDMEQGYGVVLIENKGDLFHAAMNYVPPNRMQDVIMFDVTDTRNPLGYNLLKQGNAQVAIDNLTALFDYLYRENKSVWTRELMYHGLRTLILDPKLTFVDLAPLLMPMTADEKEWRSELLKRIDDPELRNFWARFNQQPPAAQERIVQPVLDRIWQLNARPELRNIIGQSESSFQMKDVVAQNKILLVNLSGLARDTASLTGSLLMNDLWTSVRSTRSEKPTFLYLDEFQDFVNLPVEPEDMLAKARSFGLGMTLAHQHLGQLTTDLKMAVLNNARTKVVFQTSAEDARAMTREFGTSVSDQDFMHLSRYEALARVATADGVSPPLTLSTNAPARPYGLYKDVAALSRGKYGRAVEHVEKQIRERRSLDSMPKKRRPKLSDGGWGAA